MEERKFARDPWCDFFRVESNGRILAFAQRLADEDVQLYRVLKPGEYGFRLPIDDVPELRVLITSENDIHACLPRGSDRSKWAASMDAIENLLRFFTQDQEAFAGTEHDPVTTPTPSPRKTKSKPVESKQDPKTKSKPVESKQDAEPKTAESTQAPAPDSNQDAEHKKKKKKKKKHSASHVGSVGWCVVL
jgi:hypothetical protein